MSSSRWFLRMSRIILYMASGITSWVDYKLNYPDPTQTQQQHQPFIKHIGFGFFKALDHSWSTVASLKQGDLSITEFFTKLRIVWDELENFRPNPICVCATKCSCSVLSVINQRRCEDQAMQFVHGLNDQYQNIRSHVLLMEPMPPITNFFSLVAQQERQLASNFLTTSVNSFNSNWSIPAIFSFCGKNGYTENACFRKIGFPNQEKKV